MHSFAPDHEGPRVSDQIRGAIVVTPTTVRSLVEAGERFLKDDAVLCRFVAISSGHEPLVIDSLDELLTLRNPHTAPIEGLLLALNTTARGLHIFIGTQSSDGAAVRLDAISDSVDDLSALRESVRAEAKNSTAWYSPFRWLYDTTFALVFKVPGRVRLIIGTLLVVLWIAWVVLGSLARADLQHWQENAASVVDELRRGQAEGLVLDDDTAAKVNRIENALASSRGVSWTRWIGVIAGSIVIGLIWPKANDVLFPRVEFTIGDGAIRHARTTTARHFVLGTVIVSGFVIPLIRSCAAGG
ncbi:MAG: hypothetical protein HND58_09655 [Planctomycetota bacterium]|nr:MAG: hypothetical protein HND58_09655 [Planctomycetota bacterium]